MEKSFIPRIFVVVLLVFILYFCYLIFKPFLTEIMAAAILVSIFYTPYEWLVRKTKDRRSLSALIMCLLIALVVIIPLINFIVYAAQQAVGAYGEFNSRIAGSGLSQQIVSDSLLRKLEFLGLDPEAFKSALISLAGYMKDWIVSGGTGLITGTTSFIVSLALILFTMFFFFIDGERMLRQLMRWTPLPNKYDVEIFRKFRAVSYSSVVSAFVTAIAQGLIGAIGFLIVGVPAFFAGVAMAFFSLIPYVGTAIIWLPTGLYLLATGNIWQGVFLIAWGAGVIGTVDNLIRAYIIKGKAQVHPIFLIFAILGGIVLFGFWGIIFGPLIISLAVTILHIYEAEYEEMLEK